MAVLLTQKYGCGVVNAVALIYDNNRTADPIQKAVDEESDRIDPEWREHDRQRWAGRPSDVVSNI